jgi:hypothetical protein
MSTKKVTTKQRDRKAPTRTQPAATDPAVMLAVYLSDILNNPTCPARIYNAIAEELCDMSSYMDYHTPKMIADTIAAYARREEKRQKGGAA